MTGLRVAIVADLLEERWPSMDLVADMLVERLRSDHASTITVELLRPALLTAWWLVALLVGRDALLTACLPLLRRSGYGPFVVTYLGKAATFLLFWAFPVLLAAEFDNAFGVLCAAVGPALLGWGTALYLYGGVLYLLQVALALRRPVTSPTARSATPPGDTAATRTA